MRHTDTFDSIHDCVLLHDGDFRIMKANQALLVLLEKAPADVVGKTCEEVLPREQKPWSGCPYCNNDQQEFYEGADPCFGGLLKERIDRE